jgi:hypothetical protein
MLHASILSGGTPRRTGCSSYRRHSSRDRCAEASPLDPGFPLFSVAGRALSTAVIAGVMSTILLVLAKVGYGIGFGAGALVSIAITVLVETLAFACISSASSRRSTSYTRREPSRQSAVHSSDWPPSAWHGSVRRLTSCLAGGAGEWLR